MAKKYSNVPRPGNKMMQGSPSEPVYAYYSGQNKAVEYKLSEGSDAMEKQFMANIKKIQSNMMDQ